ncbi:MAG: CcoQ/FixQ family Cbb3-type cytochrome c oxidase assembly chaperone [Flavobacteriales bacterium]|nr:CcoQ/FixQ family Cbb3-type cytochrome c oxidase assembly chaperone [Flavobacteriales bacterium]
MLKFIKHHLDTIAGIDIYPVLSFIVFFLFFLGVLLWVFTVRRSHIEHMARSPSSRITAPTKRTRHAH